MQVILIRLFGLQHRMEQITREGEPLLLYAPLVIAAGTRGGAQIARRRSTQGGESVGDSSRDEMQVGTIHAAGMVATVGSDREMRTNRI